MIVHGVDIQGLTADSRKVVPGDLFAAVPGTAMNGRDFIPQAIEKGAVAVLAPAGTQADVPVIASDNVRLEYAKIARALYPAQPEVLVAMTGTNGKSSTVEFVRQIWQTTGRTSAAFGTLGVTTGRGHRPLSHTTPDAVALHRTLSELAEEGVTHAAMEASSHGLKQYRMHGVELSAAGFSNLSQDHFDYHPTVEDYFESKAKLFTELLPAGAPAVVTVDGDMGVRMADLAAGQGHKVMRVGWHGEDLRIDEIIPRAASQDVTLVADLGGKGAKRFSLRVPLAGEFQVLNVVQAIGLAVATGVDLNDALMAAELLRGVSGRLEPVGETVQGAPVFVDFAHTEDGLDKLLRSVRPHTMGKIVLVFGCGGDRDATKRPRMGAVAAKLADSVIVTDDNPRTEDAASIRAQVLAGCPGATEIGDRAAAIREGLSRLEAGDCLVVAGKGHEQGQIVGDRVIPFSDQDEVRDALKEMNDAG